MLTQTVWFDVYRNTVARQRKEPGDPAVSHQAMDIYRFRLVRCEPLISAFLLFGESPAAAGGDFSGESIMIEMGKNRGERGEIPRWAESSGSGRTDWSEASRRGQLTQKG